MDPQQLLTCSRKVCIHQGVHPVYQLASIVLAVDACFLSGVSQPLLGAFALGKTAANSVTTAVNKVMQVSSSFSDSLSSQGTRAESAVTAQSAAKAQLTATAESAVTAESAGTADSADDLGVDEGLRTGLLNLWNAERDDIFFNPDQLTDAQWAICSKVHYGILRVQLHDPIIILNRVLLCNSSLLTHTLCGGCMTMLSEAV